MNPRRRAFLSDPRQKRSQVALRGIRETSVAALRYSVLEQMLRDDRTSDDGTPRGFPRRFACPY